MVERELDEHLFTRGAQVSVSVHGEEVLAIALGDAGLGRAVTPETLFKVYCSIKPLTTLLIARLVGAAELDLDEPLRARLRGFAALERGITLRHLLTHTAGLQFPSGVFMEMTPPEGRRSVLEEYPGEIPWRIGRDAAYSEYFAWNLLGWLVEQTVGAPFTPYLRETLLQPIGLADTYVGMTASEYRAVVGRLGLNHDLKGGWPGVPMLWERTERVCCETNPAYGGYSTARDLRRLYAAVLDQLDGSANEALPDAETLRGFCSTARARTYDSVLERECEFGLGFMTGLEGHRFGQECSSTSFGHSGNVGSSFGFADPTCGLAVGVVLNGITGTDAAFLRRPALVRAIYEDIQDRASTR